MCLALEPMAMSVVPPVPEWIPCPADETVWHALSESEWKLARQRQDTAKQLDLWSLSKSIFEGMIPVDCGRISALTLLAIIAAFLSSVSTMQRMSMDIYNPCDSNYISKIERALSTWKELWLRHPRAEQSMTHLDDPLLNDCLSLLGSAYYHLYAGEELVTLKRIAKDPNCGLSLPAYKDRSEAHKIIKYAANSWLVRSKLGVRYLSKTKSLDLGAQALFNSYETGEPTILLNDSANYHRTYPSMVAASARGCAGSY